MSAWDNLSIRDKAEMMRVAIGNGITNINDIKREYNEFAEGGSIHIKPSHRGRLTELKERTGKTEAELYNDGNPAHKKMVVFARNARKWHDLGGNLYAMGTPLTEEQRRALARQYFWENKMDKAQQYAVPDAYEGGQLPEIKVFPERTQGEITPITGNALSRAINNYTGELKYDLANGRVPGGKYTLPAAVLGATGIAGLAKAGEMAYAAGATPLIMKGMNIPFVANGLNDLFHGNADWQTALELTPIAEYAKPIWNTGKAIYNTGKTALYNTADRYIFMPHQNSFTRGIGGEAGLQDLVESGLVRGNPIGTEVTAKAYGKLTRSNRNNFNDIMRDTGIDGIAHRYYNRTLTEEDFNAIKKAAQKYKENTPSSGAEGRITLLRQDKDPLSKYSSYQDYQAQLTSDRQTLANATSLDDSGQPLAYFYDNGRNPLTAGHDYAASDYGVRINNASGYNPRIFDGHLHYSMPEAVPLRDPNVEVFEKGPFGLTVKLDKETMKPVWQQDLKTLFSKSTNKAPQITAENAASITPEQWTAAQDAAIAKGDMVEAQRLRDLHFKVSAPDTKVDVPLWSSSEEPFNSFDLSHFGETDTGFFGYGHYLTPIEKYAATYHPVNRKFYVNVKNPYTGSNDQYFNRVQYVKDRLARRKENVIRNLRDGKLTRFSKKLGINESTSLEDAEHLVDKYIADETVKWNDKYIKYVDEFEGKDGVLSWRDIQGIPNKREGIYKEVVVPRGEQIKSADAVTYDDNGVRIPLGERDNFNINDIRYALLPALGVGTVSSLLNLNNLEPSEQTPHMQALGGNLFDDGGSMNSGVGKAMQYFINRGLTDYQAAGLVGNLMRESSLDHRAENKSSKAYGLAQWLGDRKTSLFKKYGNNPTFEQQLDYVWDELNSTHKNGLKMLKASKSAEEAARNAMGYYEFSAGPEKAIANMIKHGQDGEGSMRKGVNFAMGIVGQNPVEYVPQMQLPPNYNVLQNWELPTPQYTLDKLTASGTMMPAKELPLTTRIPSSGERPNALLDLLAQYQYLDSLLSQ